MIRFLTKLRTTQTWTVLHTWQRFADVDVEAAGLGSRGVHGDPGGVVSVAGQGRQVVLVAVRVCKMHGREFRSHTEDAKYNFCSL